MIAVKGAPAVTERVLVTPRGPVVSPALTETSEALSLRATWLDPLPARGFFGLAQVSSFTEFRAAEPSETSRKRASISDDKAASARDSSVAG